MIRLARNLAVLFLGHLLCFQAFSAGDTLPVIHGLNVHSLGKTYLRDPGKVPDYLFYAKSNTGGTTSIRRIDAKGLEWKAQGYYQRNRELGQTFYVPAGDTIQIDALVLRTGNSSKAILQGAAGAEVFVQFFEVEGSPVIDDNGTPPGTNATHGFTTNHRADDFLKGVRYRPMLLVRGGIFPDLPATTREGEEPGHLHYLRWDLQGEGEIVLPGGKRYAFMLGFSSDGPEKGFSLGNDNEASNPAPPALRKDANGQVWWSIRREGDGTLPPSQAPGENPPAKRGLRRKLMRESLFQKGYEYRLSPTTNGFPDVDTYRTMEFYLEIK